MDQTRRSLIAQQRSRLNSAAASLRQSRVFFHRYRYELSAQYSSEESARLITACNECIQSMNYLHDRMELLSPRLLWLERIST